MHLGPRMGSRQQHEHVRWQHAKVKYATGQLVLAVKERVMAAVNGLNSSATAGIIVRVVSLADSAVAADLSRGKALALAAHTVADTVCMAHHVAATKA